MIVSLVVAVVLCVSLLYSSLTALSGSVFVTAKRMNEKLQQVYDRESDLLMFLNGMPSPEIFCQTKGPWLDVSSRRMDWGSVHVLVGLRNDSLSRGQKRQIADFYRAGLKGDILMGRNLKIKSGNRRLFHLDDPAGSTSLVVEDGDLLVDLTDSCSSCNFMASGSLTVRGTASFDTLRLYAAGPVLLAGSVRVRWLELFGADNVEVAGQVQFSGAILANNEVRLRQRSAARFPSILMSLNGSVEYEPRNVPDTLLLPAAFLGERCLLDGLAGNFYPLGWSLQ